MLDAIIGVWQAGETATKGATMPKAKPKVVVYPPGTEWVFVDINVMLGDGDGTIQGFAVLTKEKWEKDKANFKKALTLARSFGWSSTTRMRFPEASVAMA